MPGPHPLTDRSTRGGGGGAAAASGAVAQPEPGQERLRLKGALTPLWRDDATVQIGLESSRSLVVSNVDSAGAALLRRLDGRHTRAELVAGGPASTGHLLALLEAASVLEPVPLPVRSPRGRSTPVPDPVVTGRLGPELGALGLLHTGSGSAGRLLDARRHRRALVIGPGRVGTSVAHLLAASGLGRVQVEGAGRVRSADLCPAGATAADIGLSRAAAATALAVRAVPPELDAGPPDVAVLCSDGADPPRRLDWQPLVRSGVPTLTVAIRETTAVVGPFSMPGACCPGCVELHRWDRDPCWPELAAQLELVPPAVGFASAATVAVTAAVAVGQVLGLLDLLAEGGDPLERSPSGEDTGLPTVDASIELPLPDWRWRRRPWGRHDECVSCSGPAAA